MFMKKSIFSNIDSYVKTRNKKQKPLNFIEILQSYGLGFLVILDYLDHDILQQNSEFKKASTFAKSVLKKKQDQKYKELCSIADMLYSHNIEWVLLKEYAFDETYCTLGYVYQNDFDILIREKHWDNAIAVFKDHGFTILLSDFENAVTIQKNGITSIDLHKDIVRRRFHEPNHHLLDYYFYNKRIVRYKDLDIPCLDIHASLCFQLIHSSTHHNYYPLEKTFHVWNFIQKYQYDFNWNYLNNLVYDLHVSSLCRFSFKFIENIWRTNNKKMYRKIEVNAIINYLCLHLIFLGKNNVLSKFTRVILRSDTFLDIARFFYIEKLKFKMKYFCKIPKLIQEAFHK